MNQPISLFVTNALLGLTILGSALGLCVLSSIVYYDRFHPLAKFDGPFIASFTNLWKVYHVYVGDLEHVLLEAHRRYGKVVRIGPNHLDVSDAAAVKQVYGSGRAFQKRYGLRLSQAERSCC